VLQQSALVQCVLDGLDDFGGVRGDHGGHGTSELQKVVLLGNGNIQALGEDASALVIDFGVNRGENREDLVDVFLIRIGKEGHKLVEFASLGNLHGLDDHCISSLGNLDVLQDFLGGFFGSLFLASETGYEREQHSDNPKFLHHCPSLVS